MGANFWIDQISAIRTDCGLTADGTDGGWFTTKHTKATKSGMVGVARVPSGATSDMARMIANGRPTEYTKGTDGFGMNPVRKICHPERREGSISAWPATSIQMDPSLRSG
jgi:hypothetical protein